MNFPELTEDEREFFEGTGKEPTEVNVLCLRMSMVWLQAVGYDDFKWMRSSIRKMKQLHDKPQLVRLKGLYVWMLNNPPKRQ